LLGKQKVQQGWKAKGKTADNKEKQITGSPFPEN